MATDNHSEHVRLRELGNSRYEVSKHESDIRGWIVKNQHGRILGKVNDLLFDKESGKVLYIVLDLEGNEMHLRDRKVLAPLSVAQINEAYKNVVFPGAMAIELTELPTYEKGKVSTRVEDLVIHAFAAVLQPQTGQQDQRQSPAHLQHMETAESSNKLTQIADKNRPQTVVGVFEHTNQAQAAIEYLLGQGFKRNQIEVSGRDVQYSQTPEDEDHSITNWFKSVFGNEQDAKTYADAARTGSVVTIQTSSYQEAEAAAGILDQHGAMDVSDSHADDRSGYRSRILDRREANARWGR